MNTKKKQLLTPEMLWWIILILVAVLGVALTVGLVVFWTKHKKWTKHTLLSDSGGHMNISGNRLVLGNEYTKTVKLYEINQNTWKSPTSESEIKSITNTFGYNVVTNGDDLFATAYNLGEATAGVQVYGNEAGVKMTLFNQVTNGEASHFGYGMKFIDNYLFVGDEEYNKWYIYDTSSSSLSSPPVALHEVEGSTDDKLGRCIDVVEKDDDVYIVAVSSVSKYINIYTYSGGTNNPVKIITITNQTNGFGTDLKLSADGTRLVVGSIGENKVYVYDLDLVENGTSTVVGGDPISGEEGYFGRWVDISDDGSTIVAAAPDWTSSSERTGYVQIFDLDGSTWKQRGGTIYGSPGDAYETLALKGDGNTLLLASSNGVDRWVWA
jgi:hypothetical protein